VPAWQAMPCVLARQAPQKLSLTPTVMGPAIGRPTSSPSLVSLDALGYGITGCGVFKKGIQN